MSVLKLVATFGYDGASEITMLFILAAFTVSDNDSKQPFNLYPELLIAFKKLLLLSALLQ